MSPIALTSKKRMGCSRLFGREKSRGESRKVNKLNQVFFPMLLMPPFAYDNAEGSAVVRSVLATALFAPPLKFLAIGDLQGS